MNAKRSFLHQKCDEQRACMRCFLVKANYFSQIVKSLAAVLLSVCVEVDGIPKAKNKTEKMEKEEILKTSSTVIVSSHRLNRAKRAKIKRERNTRRKRTISMVFFLIYFPSTVYSIKWARTEWFMLFKWTPMTTTTASQTREKEKSLRR